MWKEVLLNYSSNNPFIKINLPAQLDEINDIEIGFGLVLPRDLKNLYNELNGDNNFIFSTNQVIETNLMMRSIEGYSQMNNILFTMNNGCGDYFGYKIAANEIIDFGIYLWEHESNSFIKKADGLREAIEKYYSDNFDQ